MHDSLGDQDSIHLHTQTHILAPSMLTYKQTHTDTHTHVLCPVISCPALPCRHARTANHRACMAQLKAIRAARNKLALLLKIFSQATFFLPRGTQPRGGKKPSRLAQPQTQLVSILFRKPVCRLLLHTHKHTHWSHNFLQKMVVIIFSEDAVM